MNLIRAESQLQKIDLKRDLTKSLRQGHRWIFSNALSENPKTKSGLCWVSYKNKTLGLGVFQADTALKFRVFCLDDEPFFRANSATKTMGLWSARQWKNAMRIRTGIDRKKTNAFRLVNGEGDGMPGLIIDIYNDIAVIKHDHEIMEKVWDHQSITAILREEFSGIKCVYLKRKSKSGETLFGDLPEYAEFLENGLHFSANIKEGSKTGFFLDQRENRELVRRFSKGANVLNLFSYTGGFSVYAAAGGAQSVTSVDISEAAVDEVAKNLAANELSLEHEEVAADAFEYVVEAVQKKKKFDVVITDPPSFAPNEKSVPQATAAYVKIFSNSLQLVREGGFFVASSCSSHISAEDFLKITSEAFSKSKSRGTLVHFSGQPSDHPSPLAMPELRYLKFALFRI